MKEIVSYDDFAKLDLKISQVVEVERIVKSDKLLKLSVTFDD